MDSSRLLHWIQGVRDNDAEAIREFCGRYASPLLRLAENNLHDRLRRRVDPEDVVQSAFRTIFRRLQGGEFSFETDDDLWQLLCAVTLNKSRQQARRHTQQKRSLDQEIYLDGTANPPGLPSTQPTPDDAATLIDLVEHFLDSATDEEERTVIVMKLDELSNEEIAHQMQRSERTIRRILARLRSRMASMLEE